MAAIHAGVLEDERGGQVTFLKAPGNDSSDFYHGSYKNGIQTHHHDGGYAFSYQFSDPLFNCPKDALEFGDNCYHFYGTLLSFEAAEEECVKNWNGHLVQSSNITALTALTVNLLNRL